jgi:hypothetical protein
LHKKWEMKKPILPFFAPKRQHKQQSFVWLGMKKEESPIHTPATNS